jgi:PAS domain S-box-containing protein
MLRIHREIARDVARVTAVPLAQMISIRDREGDRRAETLAVEGAALVTQALRGQVIERLGVEPGAAPALSLRDPEAPAHVAAPCEPQLADLLWPRRPPGAEVQSVFFRLGSSAGATTLLRVLVAGRVRAAALRSLEAVARLAAGRLAAEGFRREIAGRNGAYRVFEESAGEAILVVDAEGGRVLEANQRLCELTGHGRQEVRRLTLGGLLDHPVLDPAALLARLGAHPVVREDEARLRRRRGEPIPVSITTSRIDLDGRPVLHVIVRDVTRERRTLAELRQAKDVLAALHLAGAHLMVETDESAIYGVLGRELLRLGFHCGVIAPALDGGSGLVWRFLSFPAPLRRAIDRALGRPLSALRIDPLVAPLVRRCLSERRTVHTDQARRAVQELLGGATPQQLRRLRRLVAIRRVILAPLRREGRAVGVLAVAAPRLRKGDPEAIDAFALQASIALEKARLFGALREERARLETEVERRTAELRRAVEALEATDRRKDNFLANISHELRTPLVTVLGYTDLLLAEKLGEVAPRQRAALEVVSASGRRLKSFIEELLELSRHELTKDAYAFAPFEVGEVLTQAVIALAPRFAERGLRVRARVARGIPLAWGDRERVVQVLVNLLANAERYSPDGAPIRVAAAQVAPGRIALAVSDRGAGIPDEHLGHIFDRLYQVRDDRAPRHKGGALGIGLAIVKSIVEAHGGTVTVRSRLGRGTTFKFSLSAAEAAPAAAAGTGGS